MKSSSATTVRMFAEYGTDSVLWVSIGDVPTSSLGLDPGLVADLQAWGASYVAGLVDFRWHDRQAATAFREAGCALGRRLARELGDEFLVRVEDEEFRSPHPALNPGAAAALQAIIKADGEEREKILTESARGASLAWRAE